MSLPAETSIPRILLQTTLILATLLIAASDSAYAFNPSHAARTESAGGRALPKNSTDFRGQSRPSRQDREVPCARQRLWRLSDRA